MAAMLEAVDIDTGFGFFQSEDAAHAMVLVHLDELEGYKYWYYEDLTDLNLEPGSWLIIEPQSRIEGQGTEDWFSQWDLYMACEVDYDKAAS